MKCQARINLVQLCYLKATQLHRSSYIPKIPLIMSVRTKKGAHQAVKVAVTRTPTLEHDAVSYAPELPSRSFFSTIIDIIKTVPTSLNKVEEKELTEHRQNHNYLIPISCHSHPHSLTSHPPTSPKGITHMPTIIALGSQQSPHTISVLGDSHYSIFLARVTPATGVWF